MATGFERRDVIQDANVKSRATEASSIPLSMVQTPTAPNLSRIGQTARDLQEALGRASVGLERYVDKKKNEWLLDGQLARIEGQTYEDISKTDNIFTRQGWEAMNLKIAGDDLFLEEQDFISNEGKMLSPKEYRERLTSRTRKLVQGLPASDSSTREMVYASAVDLYPRLVAQQTKEYNEWNKKQTIFTGRTAIAKSALIDGPEATRELLELEYGLDNFEKANMIAGAVEDAMDLGDEAAANIEAAITSMGTGKPAVTNPRDSRQLLNLIGHGESGGNYKAIHGGEKDDLTNLTLDEVLEWQDKHVADGAKSSAAGKYQIIRKTLSHLKDSLELSGDEIFDEDMQDSLALALMKQRGFDEFVNGDLSAEEFQKRLSMEWAALPKDNTGAGYYDGDGLNKANIQPGELLDALSGVASGTQLFTSMTEMGLPSSAIVRISKKREELSNKRSHKFTAQRISTENKLINSAIDMSDAELVEAINNDKEANGYSDSWANGVFNEGLAARKAAAKERKETDKIVSALNTNSVAMLSQADQQKAVDTYTSLVLSNMPQALDPSHPQHAEYKAQAEQEVFRMMYKNRIRDDRLTNAWDVAVLGDIVDTEGNVKPSALDAYVSYQNARNATNDPLFASTLLSDNTRNLFEIADSYRTSEKSTPDAALKSAAAFLSKQQQTSTKTIETSWWQDWSLSQKVHDTLLDKTIPSLLNGFYGWDRSWASGSFWINSADVRRGAMQPHVTSMIKQRAAEKWDSMKHWSDQDAARERAMHSAAVDVLGGSEYIAGSFVYSGKESIASKIGMAGIQNASHMVVSRVLNELGPSIWEDYNSPDWISMSQEWYEKPDSVWKSVEGVTAAATQPMNLLNGIMESTYNTATGGISPFEVILNKSGNVLTVHPYTNLDRTRVGPEYTLSVEMLREAASYLKKGDEDGFKKWAEEQKKGIKKR